MALRTTHRYYDDPSVVLALQRGEPVRFEDIYRVYEKRVRAVCRRYLKDPRDVEEATQDTFIKAHSALPRFNGSFRMGAWLARIAANTAMDVARRNRRRPEDAVPPGSDVVDLRAAALDELESIDAGTAGDILRGMRADYARALLMRMEDASLVEVGEALGKSPEAAKALLHRARTSFRKAWQDVGGNVAFIAVAGALLALRFGRSLFSHLSRVQNAGTSDGIAAPVALLSENLPFA